jgi:hypothetical protein
MDGGKINQLNTGVIILLIIIFVFLLYKNIKQDIDDEERLSNIICHKEVNVPKIKEIDILVIESIIEEYNKKKAMNISNYASIWSDTKKGIFRGVLGGVIIGGGMEGIIISAITFGTLSGFSKAYDLKYGYTVVLNDYKHT